MTCSFHFPRSRSPYHSYLETIRTHNSHSNIGSQCIKAPAYEHINNFICRELQPSPPVRCRLVCLSDARLIQMSLRISSVAWVQGKLVMLLFNYKLIYFVGDQNCKEINKLNKPFLLSLFTILFFLFLFFFFIFSSFSSKLFTLLAVTPNFALYSTRTSVIGLSVATCLGKGLLQALPCSSISIQIIKYQHTSINVNEGFLK